MLAVLYERAVEHVNRNAANHMKALINSVWMEGDRYLNSLILAEFLPCEAYPN